MLKSIPNALRRSTTSNWAKRRPSFSSDSTRMPPRSSSCTRSPRLSLTTRSNPKVRFITDPLTNTCCAACQWSFLRNLGFDNSFFSFFQIPSSRRAMGKTDRNVAKRRCTIRRCRCPLQHVRRSAHRHGLRHMGAGDGLHQASYVDGQQQGCSQKRARRLPNHHPGLLLPGLGPQKRGGKVQGNARLNILVHRRHQLAIQPASQSVAADLSNPETDDRPIGHGSSN